MNIERPIPKPPYLTPEEIEEDCRIGLEQARVGKGVPHEEVAKWLRTWGQDPQTPFPAEWLK